MILKRDELAKITGGGWMQVAGVFAGIFTFLVGVVDGIFRPLSCEK